MKEVVTYLLLAVFCFNIFGAGIGEVMHIVVHSFEKTSYQLHSHRQKQSIHAHPHPHVGEEDAHEHIFEFLLEDTDLSEAQSVLLLLRDLNLLMIGLIGLISTSAIYVILLDRIVKITPTRTVYTFNYQEIPTPPPRQIL